MAIANQSLYDSSYKTFTAPHHNDQFVRFFVQISAFLPIVVAFCVIFRSNGTTSQTKVIIRTIFRSKNVPVHPNPSMPPQIQKKPPAYASGCPSLFFFRQKLINRSGFERIDQPVEPSVIFERFFDFGFIAGKQLSKAFILAKFAVQRFKLLQAFR